MNFKLAFLIIFLISATSCSKKEETQSNATTKEHYYSQAVYPENKMESGEGVKFVGASEVACYNSKGIKVDKKYCPGVDSIDPSTLPPEKQESPAGPGQVAIENATGTITVIFQIGQTWNDISESNKTSIILDYNNAVGINCVNGYQFSFDGRCVIPRYEYRYTNFENDLLACTGSDVRLRAYTCHFNVTGTSADLADCSGETLSREQTLLSPAGQNTQTLPNGDTVVYTCNVGKTTADVGNGSSANTISCGTDRHLASGSCLADTYIATYSYPANTLTVGQGSRSVEANAVATCTRTHDLVSMDTSKCPMPSTKPTITQLSPAGVLETTNPSGDVYNNAYAEGATVATVTLKNCANEDRYKVSGTENCANHVYVASDFTYPTNTLAVGQGTREVEASGFNICTRQLDSVVVASAKCSLPLPLPKMTQLSPAGLIEILNAEGDTLNNLYVEGSTTPLTTLKNCNPVTRYEDPDNAGTCLDHTYIASDFSFPVNNLAIGQGQETVEAISFNTCTRVSDNVQVGLGNCEMPEPKPTHVNLSPAGHVEFTIDGDYYKYFYPEGSTVRTIDTVTCSSGKIYHNDLDRCDKDLVSDGLAFSITPSDSTSLALRNCQEYKDNYKHLFNFQDGHYKVRKSDGLYETVYCLMSYSANEGFTRFVNRTNYDTLYDSSYSVNDQHNWLRNKTGWAFVKNNLGTSNLTTLIKRKSLSLQNYCNFLPLNSFIRRDNVTLTSNSSRESLVDNSGLEIFYASLFVGNVTGFNIKEALVSPSSKSEIAIIPARQDFNLRDSAGTLINPYTCNDFYWELFIK